MQRGPTGFRILGGGLRGSQIARYLGTSAVLGRQSERTVAFDRIAKKPKNWQAEVDLYELVRDFRSLQALSKLGKGPEQKSANDEGVREYKFAERSLFPYLPEKPGANAKVKLSALKELIPPEQGRAWEVIGEKTFLGQAEKLKNLDDETRAAILFYRIYGMGPTRAWKFAQAGCRKLSDLESEKYGKLYGYHRLGIQYIDDIEKLIPRKESEAFASKFAGALKGAREGFDFEGELLGSFARGEAWSSDIDYVIHSPQYAEKDEDISKSLLKSVVDRLIERKILLPDHLAFGFERWTGLGKLPGHKTVRRVDIRLMPMESYGCAKLRSSQCAQTSCIVVDPRSPSIWKDAADWTIAGDLEFLKEIQNVAKLQGLLLNERGLGKRLTGEDRGLQKGADTFDPDHMIPTPTEADVFKALRVSYVPPEKRNYQSGRHILREFQQNVDFAPLT